MKQILIMDTSILCVWLKIPGKETCGPTTDLWDYDRVNKLILKKMEENTTFILPLATIIETGNHISQASEFRYERAQTLCEIILKCVNNKEPWGLFSEQSKLWGNEELIKLAETWPDHAATKLSIGDTTILAVADYYAKAAYSVEIFTGDQQLKSYESQKHIPIPRRKKY